MQTRYVLGLRHLEGDGESAVLPFASKLRGRSIAQQQEHVVAVAPNECSPIIAVPFARGSQLLTEIAFNAGQVLHFQFFRVIRNTPIREPGKRGDAWNQFRAHSNNLGTKLYQLLGKTIQTRFVESAPLE